MKKHPFHRIRCMRENDRTSEMGKITLADRKLIKTKICMYLQCLILLLHHDNKKEINNMRIQTPGNLFIRD